MNQSAANRLATAELAVLLCQYNPKRNYEEIAQDADTLYRMGRTMTRLCIEYWGKPERADQMRRSIDARIVPKVNAVIGKYPGLIAKFGGDPYHGVTGKKDQHYCAGSCFGIEGLPQNWIRDKEFSLP